MLPILPKSKKQAIIPTVTLRDMRYEFAVAIRPDVEVGRIAERKSGWAAYSVRGYLGLFTSQAAAVAALTVRIIDDCPF